jgi:uncharacterized repeat protein (TIGR02543 family)
VGGTEIEGQRVKKGLLAEMPKTPEKFGYDFAGWYYNGEKWNFEKDIVVKDITLTAMWTPKTIKVMFDCNGGNGNVGDRNIKYGEAYGEMPVPTRTGYDFKGWYLDGKKVEATDKVNVEEEHTLCAEWEAKIYTITFETFGGTQIAAHKYRYGEKTVAPENPVRSGDDFAEWLFSCDGFKFGDNMPAEDITATARWTYKIIHYNSDESKIVDDKDLYVYDVIDISEISRYFIPTLKMEFKVRIYMKEIDMGYQEIYLCDKNQTKLNGVSAFQYGGDGNAKTEATWEEFTWYVSGEKCTEQMLLCYSAHGGLGDRWQREKVEVTVTIIYW